MDELQRLWEEATVCDRTNPDKAAHNYHTIINTPPAHTNLQDSLEDFNRLKEEAIYNLGKLYARLG